MKAGFSQAFARVNRTQLGAGDGGVLGHYAGALSVWQVDAGRLSPRAGPVSQCRNPCSCNAAAAFFGGAKRFGDLFAAQPGSGPPRAFLSKHEGWLPSGNVAGRERVAF